MRIVLLGYYGYGNIGDEAGLGVILGRLREIWPNASLTVVSGSPEDSRRQHGVEAISRANLPGLRRLLQKTDVFLLGGGGLLQDTTSFRSLLYYLAMIRLAEQAGASVILYGQGVGPLTRLVSRRLTARTLRNARLIAVRDQTSAQILSDLGLGNRLRVGADPVFGLQRPDASRGKALLAERGLSGHRLVGVALRRIPDPAFLPAVAGYLRWVEAEAGLQPVYLSFHSPQDDSWARRLEPDLDRPLVSFAGLSPTDFLAVIGELDLLLGVRLHSLVMAAAVGTPFLGVSYDPKIDAVLEPFGVRGIPPASFRPEVVGPLTTDLLARREEISQKLRAETELLAKGEERLWREIRELVEVT